MSLISTEPQSRTALDGHSNNLTTQFDTQLEIIVDRYLSFFQERSVGLALVLCSMLIHQSSGEVLKRHSQFSKGIPYIGWANVSIASTHYGTSTSRHTSLIPRLTPALSQLQQERRGTKSEVI